MLVSARALLPDRDYRLRLVLPRMVSGKDELEVEARTIWCRPDKNPAYHRIGFAFRDVGGEDAFLLEDVLHTFHLVG
jgi:hypothetical protein